MVELTEVVLQRGDFEFMRLLNQIREGEIDDHVCKADTISFSIVMGMQISQNTRSQFD